ncbi:sterol carrier family protein [Gordonia humi]|uniref:sterol carrier family protein n=1 Tax=Gordonia humi TaxID=686429 RepID=UPI00360B0A7D
MNTRGTRRVEIGGSGGEPAVTPAYDRGMLTADLHTHTRYSDGTDTPQELLAAARAAGLTTVGLTDHDTADGWAETAEHVPAGMRVIPGAEFSTKHPREDGSLVSVHLLGYLFRPDDAAIVAEWHRIVDERTRRGERIVESLVAAGYPVTVERVQEIAGRSNIGRPHIARALIDAGVIGSVAAAFDGILEDGGPHHVTLRSTTLVDGIAMIAAAGECRSSRIRAPERRPICSQPTSSPLSSRSAWSGWRCATPTTTTPRVPNSRASQPISDCCRPGRATITAPTRLSASARNAPTTPSSRRSSSAAPSHRSSVSPVAPKDRIDPAQTRAAVLAVQDWLRDETLPNPPRPALAAAVRATARSIGQDAPGNSVELRVPPFVAVQCIEGVRHTRGTPPNVVETTPRQWLLLATGLESFDDAVADHRVSVSGHRAGDVAAFSPRGAAADLTVTRMPSITR